MLDIRRQIRQESGSSELGGHRAHRRQPGAGVRKGTSGGGHGSRPPGLGHGARWSPRERRVQGECVPEAPAPVRAESRALCLHTRPFVRPSRHLCRVHLSGPRPRQEKEEPRNPGSITRQGPGRAGTGTQGRCCLSFKTYQEELLLHAVTAASTPECPSSSRSCGPERPSPAST